MKKISLVLLSFLIFTAPTFGQADTESFLNKSNQFQKDGKFDEAIAELSKAITVQPNNADLYLSRANLYLLTQNKQNLLAMYDAALADLNKAIEMDSDENVGLFLRRGDVYFSMQKYSEAIKEYEQVLKQKTGLEPLAEKRISQAKQKMQENGVQPK